MTVWPKPTREDLINFYGDPDANNDGKPDVKWESLNLTYVTPPYPMYWSWSGQPAKRIKVHKKCADALETALKQIGACYTEQAIKDHQLDQCGGAYNFRLMRGGNSLSMHSYGCAIDLAPEINGLGKRWDPNDHMMPYGVVNIFAETGAKWGGRWSRPDCMHFEWTG